MSKIPRKKPWLNEAGYDYYCFVSYPRIKTSQGKIDLTHPINQCARKVQKAIEQRLRFTFPTARVFIDEQGIVPGAKWEPTLRRALCKSLMMVAICADVYYDVDEHEWCGLEWAAMSALGERRLPGSDLTTIFPLLFTSDPEDLDLLPEPVRQTQYIDISSSKLYPGFYSTETFNSLMWQVVRHIRRVAQVIERNRVEPGCGAFVFPTRSAFDGWELPEPPAPFYTTGDASSYADR